MAGRAVGLRGSLPSGSLGAMAHAWRVLCVNAGSSSLKIAVYDMGPCDENCIAEGEVEGVGSGHGRLKLFGRDHSVDEERAFPRLADAVEAALEALGAEFLTSIQGVGHRVVHGGQHRDGPSRVDAALVAELRALVPWAPLHQAGALDAIDSVGRRLADIPHVACFDTAFHRRLPKLAQRLPLPEWLWEAGVRRYGFHGLSFESVTSELGSELAPRTVIAHLGNGASLVALRDGQPVETTMGFTPAGGVTMGTRSGDLDPGVLLYLLRERGFDADRLDRLVNQEAGLLGVSGQTSDMRTLLEIREAVPDADLAVSLFCRGVRKAIGSLAAVLGGIDLLVFTGAIGERSDRIRQEILAGLGHLGIGAAGDRTSAATCAVRIVPTRENLVIARHVHSLLADGEGRCPDP